MFVGVASGTCYVTVVGLLAIQAAAVRAGARVDLSNQLIALADPSFPALQYVAVGSVGALVAIVAIRIQRWVPRGIAATGCVVALLTLALLIAISWRIGHGYIGKSMAFAPGWQGWIQFGGQNPAVFVVSGLLVFSLVELALDSRSGRAENGPTRESRGTADEPTAYGERPCEEV